MPGSTALLLLTPLMLCLGPSAWAAPSLRGLGDLPGGIVSSIAYAVSSDGTTVVGRSSSAAGHEGFVWNADTGMVGLGHLPGFDPFRLYSEARGVSADGSLVVGLSGQSDGSISEAYIWDATNGLRGLGGIQSGVPVLSAAYGITGDGSKVVGESLVLGGDEAFVWSAGDGMQGIGDLPGSLHSSHANAISADGTTIVGWGSVPAGVEAFIWQEATGMLSLGDLPGGLHQGVAFDVSADGSTVVGHGRSDSGFEAFIWTADGGLRGLGDLPGGGFQSVAHAISGDGSIVVGEGFTARNEAFIWDEAHGMRSLENFLVGLGLELAGWQLLSAQAVSHDGSVLVGSGINPSGVGEAWLVVIPEPSTAYLLALGLAAVAVRRDL